MSQAYAGGIITANQNAYFSGRFSGLNSFLSFPGAAQYAIATSTTPFTIEAWIKPNIPGGLIFSEDFPSSPTMPINCSLSASNDVSQPTGLFPAFGWYNGSAWTTAAASNTPVVLNTWTHVAFVFTGSTSRIYINGVNVTRTSSPTPSTTWGITGNNGVTWYIGRRWDTGGSGIYWNGSINNFRFVNGTAVYTANFTPPTNLTPITNTVMLTCQGPTFIDASSFAATITNNGGVIVGTDNPFYTQSSPALGAATPGVWTLIQANQAAGQRSWPMYDPYFNLTTSMVHGNGTNGGTNNTFLDSSSNNFAVTRNGNATQGTFTPFSEPTGYWGNYFDGTGDSFDVAGNTNLAFGTGDWTIEFFMYPTVVTGDRLIYDSRPAATQGLYPAIYQSAATIKYFTNSGDRITSNSVLQVGQWVHIVVSRVSSVTRMFINGVQQTTTYADTTNYINGTSRPKIGDSGQNPNAGAGVLGYLSNLRVLKGTGTTAPTVPTAPLTAIPNTQLLTCQNGSFIDNSANAFPITKNGDARTIGFSPFYNPTAYLPQINGGGMYFDGSGDYLDVSGNSNLEFGTGDFTIEMFVYLTGLNTGGAYGTFYSTNPINTFGNYPNLYLQPPTGGVTPYALVWLLNNTEVIRGTTPLKIGDWSHVVASRASGNTRLFLNGNQEGSTYSDSTNYLNPTGRPRIAGNGYHTVVSNITNIAGYISNVRVLKGTGVTSVTVPTAPLTPIPNTQLLLSGTNASFIDNAANLTIETVNTSISTAQSKYGGSSMSFNGTSAYANIVTPFGNGGNVVQILGDFTVEAWVNPTVVNVQQTIFAVNANTTAFAGCRLDINTTGGVQLLVSTSGSGHAINLASTYAIPAGTWTHLAVVRAGPSFTVYFNGAPAYSSISVGITTSVLAGTISSIGGLFNSTWGGFFNGYISDFRTTNYARYLGNFTPPTSTLQNQ
jgi:hypothetical protein